MDIAYKDDIHFLYEEIILRPTTNLISGFSLQ